MNTSLDTPSLFYWIAVSVVLIVSSARITRLLTFDKFPPIEKIRSGWLAWVDKRDSTRGYGRLWFCGWCMSFWVTLLIVGWAFFAGVLGDPLCISPHPVATLIWWLVNGTFASSYLAAMVMAHDGDVNDDDEDEN